MAYNEKSRGLETDDTERDDIVAGRNGVRELLKSGRTIDKIYIQTNIDEAFAAGIIAEASKIGVPIVRADKRRLDAMAADHRGIAAVVAAREYDSVEDMLSLALSKGEKPLIVICDSINDPQNLGAIIRCAECAGAHGVIIPKRHAVSVTSAVIKASAGASEHMLIARVGSLASAVEVLKKNNVWIYALEADGEPVENVKFDTGTALILGSEGEGVSQLLRKNSDFVISIKMYGKLNSLNVSAAAAVMLFRAAGEMKK